MIFLRVVHERLLLLINLVAAVIILRRLLLRPMLLVVLKNAFVWPEGFWVLSAAHYFVLFFVLLDDR